MIFGSQKRDPCKSFYMVPNEIMRLGLSVGEIAVYNYLMYCEDHNTYQCYPSYRKMGEALGLTRKTVMKHVRNLEDKCLISTEQTTVTLKSGKKQNGNLLYTIRPIQEAVDYFNAQQLRKAEQEIREKMDDAHVRSLNAFVLKAIDFYLGYLRQGKNLNFISPILASSIKSEIKNTEHNLSEMVYKMAVQLSMLTQIVADDKNFYPEYLDELHKWCAERVASTNGIISLEDMQQRENVYTDYDYFYKDEGDY